MTVHLFISLLKFLPQDAFGFHLVLFFLVALTSASVLHLTRLKN